MNHRYVSDTASRWERPTNHRRWYQCFCGRWWGVNKSYDCVCGAPRRASRLEALAAQRKQILHLASIGWNLDSVRGYIYRGEPLHRRPFP